MMRELTSVDTLSGKILTWGIKCVALRPIAKELHENGKQIDKDMISYRTVTHKQANCKNCYTLARKLEQRRQFSPITF